jgi:hypothetical protein
MSKGGRELAIKAVISLQVCEIKIILLVCEFITWPKALNNKFWRRREWET